MQPKVDKKPFLFDRFIKGTPSQVSSENFAVSFSIANHFTGENNMHSQTQGITCKNNTLSTYVQADEAFILLRRGQMKPREGIAIKIYVKLKKKEAYRGDWVTTSKYYLE